MKEMNEFASTTENCRITKPRPNMTTPSSSPSTTASTASWAVPFLLGAISSLSLVWIFQQQQQPSRDWSDLVSTKIHQSARRLVFSLSSDNYRQQQLQQQTTGSQDILMDRPDLDQRMLRKAEAVIQWRTGRLILVIERCTNNHNYSAILRTAEALGIQTVFIIDPPDMDYDEDDNEDKNDDDHVEENGTTDDAKQQRQQQTQQQIKRTAEEIQERRLHHLFAQNATSWLTIQNFETSEQCVAEIRNQGYQLWVTDLSQEAVALGTSTPTVPHKVALVMGTEAVGASQYILDQADKRVYLPLRGFADSLNLSVATALILHHIFLMDPTLVGSMSEDERRVLRRDWYTKLCQQRILTASQKKQRVRLLNQVQKCQMIQDSVDRDPNYKIQPHQQKKLDQWPNYKKELDALEALIDPIKVKAAIQEWVDHPPDPLTDLRRADVHRVCFVGKNTKEMHKDHWKDMVATSNSVSLEGVTANAFREKLNVMPVELKEGNGTTNSVKVPMVDKSDRTIHKGTQAKEKAPDTVTKTRTSLFGGRRSTTSTSGRFVEKHF